MVTNKDIYIIQVANLQYIGLLGADPQSDSLCHLADCHMLHGFILSSQQCNIICKVQISEVMTSLLDTEVCRVCSHPHHIVDDHNEQEWL